MEGRAPESFSAYRTVARQMDQRRLKTRCFRGMGRVAIVAGGETVNSLAAVRIEPPYGVDIEFIDEAVGTVGWIRGDYFRVEGMLNQHPIAAENDRAAIKKELGISFDVGDLAMAMMGLVPQDANERYDEWWINPLGRAESPDGLMEMMLDDALQWPKSAVVYRDDDHRKEIRRMVFDDYNKVNEFWVPRSIRIEEGKWNVTVDYRELSLSTKLGCEVGG